MGGKIFGIGLQRTGTTSLFQALTVLGFHPAPHGIPLFYDIHHPILTKHDAFMDNPIPLIYRELDQKCPGSRFVMTTRPLESWLESVEWLFLRKLPKMSRDLRQVGDEIHTHFYDTSIYNRDLFAAKYVAYHQGVFDYFRMRQEDLLVVDFTKGGGWSEFCPFLGKPVPDVSFPHANPSIARN
ncbi:sulfotransferase family protein [Marinoscillum sp.]|uniref:sulfotransferase family protein n=1 Tax=Marinoscillum sp. TaxID=2024838 RepID=UPI0032F6770B